MEPERLVCRLLGLSVALVGAEQERFFLFLTALPTTAGGAAGFVQRLNERQVERVGSEGGDNQLQQIKEAEGSGKKC